MGLSGTAGGGMSGFGGSLSGTGGGTKINMRTGTKTVAQVKKLQDAPIRLLKEQDIIEIYDSLSDKGKAQCDGFVHL